MTHNLLGTPGSATRFLSILALLAISPLAMISSTTSASEPDRKAAPAQATSAKQPSSEDADKAGIAANIQGFVKAFNQHDAKAATAGWKADAVHIQKNAGIRTAGRDALTKAYSLLFESDPKITIEIKVQGIRKVAKGVVSVDCAAQVKHGNGKISESEFVALLVEDNGRWLIDQVQESDLPTTPTASEALSQLEWLVGTWNSTGKDEVQVVNEVKWAPGRNFLLRTYRQTKGKETIREGTQMIGWDPEHREVRSWVFDADGGFGEGQWQRTGANTWTCKQIAKLPDGRRASMTQIIERTGENELSIRTLDVDVAGASQPGSGPHTLKRQASATPTKGK